MNRSCAMKSCVLIFFLALLCAERAQGLNCYNCTMIPFGNTCSSTATCPYPDGVCAIQVAEVVMSSVRQKVKDHICLPDCPKIPQTTEILGTVVDTKISCCNTDLCNAAGPTGGCTWTVAGVLLFSLGSVLLQTLLEGSSKAQPPLSFYPHVCSLLPGAL
ncbi:lymphocyte antigen 6B-like [Rattus rattus]|uniref:lymphocyte antigen 6B-like n=1 Tax=Rattus rattus TaxID=10117 RepID=UPI0013F34B5C|nr:lymphocyte antigen 6B-like [Rattus rattus]